MTEVQAAAHGVRIVDVYLTKQVCQYLGGVGPTDSSAEGQIEGEAIDSVITQVDGLGGVFVQQASKLDEEGSGVWVDAGGNEQHGPDLAGGFEISDQAEAFEDKRHSELSAADQRLAQLETELQHWQQVAAVHYAKLVDHGLGGLPDDLIAVEPVAKPKAYEFKLVGTCTAAGLGKLEIMEELYDVLQGRRSEHLTNMQIETTKVKRAKH